MRVSIACDDGTFMFPKECPKGFNAKRLRGGAAKIIIALPLSKGKYA